MTIDQRLERLTERHEALTQSVELLVYSQRKNEEMLTHVVESIDSLARIAHLHEHRLSDLEGGAR